MAVNKTKPKPSSRNATAAMLEKLPFVKKGPSRYSREAFFVGDGQFAHFHSPTELDLKLTRPNVQALKAQHQGRPGLNFRKGPSDWLELDLKAADRRLVRSLIKTAYETELSRKA